MAGSPPENRANSTYRSPSLDVHEHNQRALANDGAAENGFKYTGATILSQTGSGRHMPVWQGELHGAWGSDRNPALDLGASAEVHKGPDGELSYPSFMLLHGQHPNMPKLSVSRIVSLRHDDGVSRRRDERAMERARNRG